MAAVLFLAVSVLITCGVEAAARMQRRLPRILLLLSLVFLVTYGTFVTARHFDRVQFYSGFISWNLRYSAYLKSKLNQGDIASVSNAVLYFDGRLRTNSESATNMISTVDSILRGEQNASK